MAGTNRQRSLQEVPLGAAPGRRWFWHPELDLYVWEDAAGCAGFALNWRAAEGEYCAEYCALWLRGGRLCWQQLPAEPPAPAVPLFDLNGPPPAAHLAQRFRRLGTGLADPLRTRVESLLADT